MNTYDAEAWVRAELDSAMRKFGPFASPHEGYAVILEELDELWVEVKAHDLDGMREEAIQVAAMALRFLVDICTEPTRAMNRLSDDGFSVFKLRLRDVLVAAIDSQEPGVMSSAGLAYTADEVLAVIADPDNHPAIRDLWHESITGEPS